MAQPCLVCTHPQRDAIEAKRRNRRSYRLIADDFGLTESSVRRHFLHHVKPSATQKVTDEKATHATGRFTNEEHDGAQALFLADFRLYGIVAHALAAAGISRNALHQWKERDGAFLVAYQQAELDANDALRHEIRRRAVEGVESYVVNHGALVYVENDKKEKVPLMERKFSDTLLIFEAKRRMAEYRDRVDVTTSGHVTHEHSIAFQDDPEAAELVHQLLRRVGIRGGTTEPGGSGVVGE